MYDAFTAHISTFAYFLNSKLLPLVGEEGGAGEAAGGAERHAGQREVQDEGVGECTGGKGKEGGRLGGQPGK